MEPLFPELPDNLGDLSHEELSELRASYQDVARRVGENDADLIGERTSEQVLSEMTGGVASIEALRAEEARRADEAAQAEAEEAARAEQIATLAAQAQDAEADAEPVAETEEQPSPDEENGEDEDDEEKPAEETEDEATAEPEATEEEAAEPVAVVASPARRKATPVRRTPTRAPAPAPARTKPAVGITAAADLRGVSAGSELGSMRDVASAMIDKHDAIRHVRTGEKFPIATLHRSLPAERTLRPSEGVEVTMAKVDTLQGVVASGGICAPPANYYDLASLVTTGTPVIDSLTGFNAERGGIQFAAPQTLADITTAVGAITEAEDASGNSTGVKTCQVVDCADFESVSIQAVYQCLEFGNMGARTWPEQVQHIVEQTMAAHARLRETIALDAIAAASTAVTSDASVANVGMISDFVPDVLRAAAMYRSRHRMDPDAPLRMLAPAWARDMAVSDTVRTQHYRPTAARDLLNDLLGNANVRVTWYIDTPTGAGQVGAAQSAGEINLFPTTLVWYLFHEGAFLYLDGGTLDLGLVRDSTLNSTNDYQVFSEVFENVAFIGVESLQVTSTLDDTGATAGVVAIPVNE